MKKLESLKEFGLTIEMQQQVCGGQATVGGSYCTDSTSTGCRGFTSDSIDGTVTTYHGAFELNENCAY